MKQQNPLNWPEGWPRTLPEHVKDQPSWKKSQTWYEGQLETELKRMGAIASVITLNDSYSRDAGVAVWFSRKRDEEDFSWREILAIRNPYPSVEDIHDAFRRLTKIHHPDIGGDEEIFKRIRQARDQAITWADRTQGKKFDFVIPADAFRERRLNLAAIVGTIQAIRKIERCGSSALMERSWKGFETALLTGGTHVASASINCADRDCLSKTGVT